MMIRAWILAALLALLPLGAEAANCNSNPFTLTNGQTADATQVMANFNNLLNCANNNLAHNAANSDITSLSGLTTPLSVPQGGTGVAAFPATNGVLIGNGSNILTAIAPSTNGNLLTVVGGTWVSTGASLSSITDAPNGGLLFTSVGPNVTASLSPGNLAPKASPLSSDQLIVADAANSFTAKLATTPSFVTGAAATKAQMMSGADNSTIVTPVRVNDSLSVAKAWANFTNSGGAVTVNASYNVTSVTRSSQGVFVITFTTPFFSTSYGSLISGTGSGFGLVGIATSQLVGSFTVTLDRPDTLTPTDPSNSATLAFFGRQ